MPWTPSSASSASTTPLGYALNPCPLYVFCHTVGSVGPDCLNLLDEQCGRLLMGLLLAQPSTSVACPASCCCESACWTAQPAIGLPLCMLLSQYSLAYLTAQSYLFIHVCKRYCRRLPTHGTRDSRRSTCCSPRHCIACMFTC